MNQETMLQAASVLLLLTAGGGVLMAYRRLAHKANPPDWLAMAHGLLAGSGLTLIIYAAVTEGVPGTVMVGLVLLAVAAAGGVVMNLAYHLAGVLIPKWLLHLHILLATLGTGLVSWGAWGG